MRSWTPRLLALLIGCTGHAQPATPAPSSADAAFARLADEYLAGHLAWRPQWGVALGLHEYDGRITDFSPASLSGELARLKAFDERLGAFPTHQLSREAQGDRLILQAALRKERFDFEDLRSYAVNPMTYAGALDVNLYLKRDFAPLEQRVRSIIAVLHQAPRIFAAARTNLEPSLPRPYVETAVEVARGSVEFLNHDLTTALRSLTNETLRAEAGAAAQEAVAQLQGFVAWLQTDRLPRAHDGWALGADKFARMLRDQESVALPPERILAVGLRELRREQEIFTETARRIDPARPPMEVFQAIQREHPTEADLIPNTRKNLETLRQFLVDRRLVTIPSEVRPRVAETPAFARATSFASMDTPGPFETRATEAYYYVTPPEADWPASQKEEWLTAFNAYTMDVVSIHEAWPGHYLQALCLNASAASRLRKAFGSYAFIEGWAHYAERMLLDQGFGDDGRDAVRAAKYRLAQSDEALLRLCRLCVAIRMHCEGMTVAEGTRFFQENCYYEEKPARQEALRGTYDPGYLNYTLGKLMLLKLRDDCRAQAGPAFSLKGFHDDVLRHGQPPIPLLRQILLPADVAARDAL
jgi:uncharacterized protein (DUF885 family)